MVGYFEDEQFGRVMVYTRRGIRNATARWDGDHLKMVVPAGITLKEVKASLDRMRDGIANLRHATVSFAIGQVLQCFRCEVTISQEPKPTDLFSYGLIDNHHGYMKVPPGCDLNNESVKRTISDGLKWLMERYATIHLIPFAQEVAESLGIVLPSAKLSVGRGMRKLGHCTRNDGRIQLSRNLMFLPEHLIRYIVCHELAHLQHPDHSAAFHALVNTYTEGREAELEAELRQFAWPVFR